MINIYIISLKGSVDRRKMIKKQLNNIGLNFEFFDAIDGKKINKNDLHSLVDLEQMKKNPSYLHLNSVGCTLSHLGIYKKIIEKNEEMALILEDDAFLSDDFLYIFSSIIKNSENIEFDIIKLYTEAYVGDVHLSEHEAFQVSNSHKLYLPVNLKENGSAIGYIIKKEAARKMLQVNEPIKMTADAWQYFYQNGGFDKMRVVFPFIVKPYGFESTLVYRTNSLKKYIKKVLKLLSPVIYKKLLRINTNRIQNLKKVIISKDKPYL